MTDSFDVIVVGGGHAGCEAAAAAARMGARTALVTHRFATVGAMSCNPAIGGLGKGQIVREIDALDGLMGRVADAAGIQFRLLNRRKGPAVRGPRAQADRKLYARAMQAEIAATPNLAVIEGEADDLVDRERPRRRPRPRRRAAARGGGRGPDHRHVPARPDPHRRAQDSGRPHGRGASVGLAGTLERFGFGLGRLKTGTPPRLDGRTIDWAGVGRQAGDDEPVPFSSLTERITTPQIECGITRTTGPVHDLIRANLHRAPMYSGEIQGRGPRYCPSIEDKVVRFADRDGHQIFLEPEGLDDPTVYPNGISTSLPEDVQRAMLQSIPGLEKAAMIAAGLRDRVRLRRSARARADAGDEAPSGPLLRRPDQRHDRLRGGGGAGACRRAERGAPRRRRRRRHLRPLRRPTSACWSTTWSRAASASPIGCSPRAPSTGSACGSTTPTSG